MTLSDPYAGFQGHATFHCRKSFKVHHFSHGALSNHKVTVVIMTHGRKWVRILDRNIALAMWLTVRFVNLFLQMSASVMVCSNRWLLTLVSVTVLVFSVITVDCVTALAHIKSSEYDSSSTEGASVANQRCGCMIGPAGPPGVPGVPGK